MTKSENIYALDCSALDCSAQDCSALDPLIPRTGPLRLQCQHKYLLKKMNMNDKFAEPTVLPNPKSATST